MLSDQIKQDIQQAYRTFLKAKDLKARYGQKVMIAEIAKTLGAIQVDDEGKRRSPGGVAVVEAGTGTGKTLGYLLATLPIVLSKDLKLVISTATVALQEQLLNKDIPDVKKHSGLDFNYALAKGRGRYLCLAKLEALMTDNRAMNARLELFESEKDEEGEFYDELLNAYGSGRWNGDRDSWKDTIEQDKWTDLTATHRECSNRRCPHFDNCAFFKARQGLDQANLVVANHDLVLADLTMGGGVILPSPDKTIYVFDEGHHLPDKAIGHFKAETRLSGGEKWLKQLDTTISKMAAQTGVPKSLQRPIERIPQLVMDIRERYQMVKQMVGPFVASTLDEGYDNGYNDGKFYRFEFGKLPEALKNEAITINDAINNLAANVDAMVSELQDSVGKDDGVFARDLAEQWFPVIGQLHSRLEAHGELWNSWAHEDPEDQPPRARWLTLIHNDMEEDVAANSSLIIAASTLRQYLWNRCYGAVVTSATLTALGEFRRFQHQSGLGSYSTYHSVPSPFDYQSKATLLLPSDIPDPTQNEAHTQAIIDFLSDQVAEDVGALVLFSARRQMRDVAEQLRPTFKKRLITQDDYSKQEVIRLHKNRIDKGQGSVILGLASFAEGIDLPGEYLTDVIIAKIPFAVPGEPVEEALTEWYESQGKNPFMEITVPDASTKLVQATGRLLRTEQDKGRVTILDCRLQTRRYGGMLLQHLPPFARVS